MIIKRLVQHLGVVPLLALYIQIRVFVKLFNPFCLNTGIMLYFALIF